MKPLVQNIDVVNRITATKLRKITYLQRVDTNTVKYTPFKTSIGAVENLLATFPNVTTLVCDITLF